MNFNNINTVKDICLENHYNLLTKYKKVGGYNTNPLSNGYFNYVLLVSDLSDNKLFDTLETGFSLQQVENAASSKFIKHYNQSNSIESQFSKLNIY